MQMEKDQLPVPCASEAEAHDLSDLGLPAVVVEDATPIVPDVRVAQPAA